jgi:NitT/TauT family transport system substrate-binding protein
MKGQNKISIFGVVLSVLVFCLGSPVEGAWRIGYSAISGAFAPLWIAADAGLFKKHGLDVELVYTRAGPVSLAALLAGETRVVAIGSDAVVAAYLAGNREVAIIAAVTNTIVTSMMAHSSIGSPIDLKGKTVAISRFGGLIDFSARYILRQHGLEPGRDVTLIQAGGVPEVIALMQRGAAQAGVMSPPTTLRAQQLGYHELVNLADLNFPYASIVIATRRTLLREQPEMIKSFLKAYVEAIAVYRKNKALAFKTLTNYTKTNDEKILEETHRAYALKAIPPFPMVPKQALESVIESSRQIKEAGRSSPGVKAEELLAMDLLMELERDGFFKTVR